MAAAAEAEGQDRCVDSGEGRGEESRVVVGAAFERDVFFLWEGGLGLRAGYDCDVEVVGGEEVFEGGGADVAACLEIALGVVFVGGWIEGGVEKTYADDGDVADVVAVGHI